MDPSTNERDVYWGPLTVKEIKHTLSIRKPVEMIDRRATISESQPSRTVYSDAPAEDYLIRQQFFGDQEDLEVTFLSEYFTPNETRSSASRYVTVCENQELDVATIQDPHVTVSEASPNDSGCVEVEADDSASKFAISISSDDDYDDDSINYIKKERRSRLSEIIEVSDSDSSFEEQQIKTKIDKCIDGLNSDDDLESETLNSSAIKEMQKSQSMKSRASEESSSNFNECNAVFPMRTVYPWKAKENKIDQSCSSENDHDSYATAQPHISVASSSSSEVQESQAEKLQVSCDSSIDFGFNDTLEEMEMALKFGLDYEENNTSSSSDTPAEKSHVLIPKTPNPKSKTLIPVKKETRLKVEAQLRQLALSPAKDVKFKVPTKRASVKRAPDAFKNILSPVGLYIKMSPQVPQVRHVRPHSVKPPLFPPVASTSAETNKENELPPCIYRPPKNVIVTQEKQLKLPGSIQKYITPVKVIKHHVKITKPKNASEVEEKLLAADLTMRSGDDSLSASVVQDTSLHSIRNAF